MKVIILRLKLDYRDLYRRPSPEKDAFVSVGDTVSEGSVYRHS